MKFLNSFASIVFLSFLSMGNISAQRIFRTNKECRRVLHFDVGGNYLLKDGRTGFHYGFGYEGIASDYLSIGFNLRNHVNGTGQLKVENGLPTNVEVQEQRVAFNLETRLYPEAALRGFYVGVGVGAGMHINQSQKVINQPNLNIYSNNFYGMGQAKVGFQYISRSNVTMAIHVGGDYFFKIDKPDNGLMLHAGIQVGFKI